MSTSKGQARLLSVLLGVAAWSASWNAQAVPSFARQTGLPCQACHTVFPELTGFGRLFKLNGYVLTGLQQIEAPSSTASSGLKLNEIPPLSAMFQAGFTHLNQSQPDTQNNDVQFPQQFSLFFAGEITPHIGTFLQASYSQPDDHVTWDNTDIRYANHARLYGDTIFGITGNNNPTVQDVWNSTPAWGFPWSGSATAPTPSATALVDGALAEDVAGLGGYTFLGRHLYIEATGYRSAHIGQPQPTSASNDTISGLAPYWRLAWQQDVPNGDLEVGTYGLYASLYPSGISGPTDNYTDVAVDTQYQYYLGNERNDNISAHATFIHEYQNLNGTFAAGGSSKPSDNLNTFRMDGTYHFGSHAALTLGYFNVNGSTDSGLYAPESVTGSGSGSPDSSGFVAQAAYLPWQNTKFVLQYRGYTKFNGGNSNYDGFGRSASDNNTLYLLAWLVW